MPSPIQPRVGVIFSRTRAPTEIDGCATRCSSTHSTARVLARRGPAARSRGVSRTMVQMVL